MAPLTVFQDALRAGGSGPEMIAAPEGGFLMGSPADEPERLEREGPQRPVRFGARFGIGRYAVTRAEFAAFVAAAGRDMSGGIHRLDGWETKNDPAASWRDPGFAQDDRHPVVGVSWNDAEAYCRWLSEETGALYRLPSEAEWEYACRAGTTTPFWFGAAITTEDANYDGARGYDGGAKGVWRRRTARVGAFRPNAWGLYQTHGNVWEWCADAWSESYEGAPDDGSARTDGDASVAVLRGGSWRSIPSWVRSATRDRNLRRYRGSDIGFRAARTIDGG